MRNTTEGMVTGEARMLVDGELVVAESGATFDNIDPSTEKVVGQVSDAGPAELDRAIEAARRAFDETGWAQDHVFRRQCLEQLHVALGDAREELRRAIVTETGSPLALTYVTQVEAPIEHLRYWAELADTYPYDSTLPEMEFHGGRHRRVVWREAVGVVGAITPWNVPLLLNLTKIGAALAAGNSVVLKPAPDTPWSATLLGRLIAEQTDIPPGIVNVVPSSDHLVGEALTADPRVDMITFTGSTATGRRVMAKGAETVKKVFLELGGKSAHVVLDDADLTQVLPEAGGMVCSHAGQGCALPTRLLLPDSRFEEGVAILRDVFANIPFGDPWDMQNIQGPQVSRRQRDRVLSYIETGTAENGAPLVGGGAPGHLEHGWYVEPTLFVDVDPMSTIAQEEIFGPVLVVLRYQDEDDAVRIANGTMYGLSASVSSGSEDRALAVARRMRAGTVMVNGGHYFSVDTPFGGYRQSGVGRENGIVGFEEFLEVKSVGIPST